MNLLGLLIVLVYISAAAAPIAGVYIVHNGNIEEMIFPPEVQSIVTNTLGAASFPFINDPNEESPSINFVSPQYKSSSYDLLQKKSQ